MQVIAGQERLLTNYEVIEVLKSTRAAKYPGFHLLQQQISEAKRKAAVKRDDIVPADLHQLHAADELCDEGTKDGRFLQGIEHSVWIRDKVLGYMNKHPAGAQDKACIRIFLSKLKTLMAGVELMKIEILMLINLRPTTLVGIHTIIDRCDDRLSEQQTLALQQLIIECLPAPAPPPQPETEETAEKEGKEEKEQDFSVDGGASASSAPLSSSSASSSSVSMDTAP
jgi:hypothetical protein